MSAWSIEALAASAAASAEAIIDLLRAHNAPYLGRPPVEAYRLLLRANGQIAGGLLGEFRSHWLHIDILVVAESLRGSGAGSALMAQAEQAARARHCHGLWLDTFDFQAPGFYERLGFRRFGLIENFHDGQARHFLEKRL